MDDNERAEWFALWKRLCRRFTRAVDPEEASDYLAYLERIGLGMPDLRSAVEAIWSTREFFPRPADFLAGESALGWSLMLDMVRNYPSENTEMDDPKRRAFDAARAACPARAWTAIHKIGGLHAIIGTADRSALRKDYIRVYEAGLQEAAYQAIALPPMSDEGRKMIETATPQLTKGKP